MLDTQINMYSIDTAHFYSNHEKYLHDRTRKYRRERNYIDTKLPELEMRLKEWGYSPSDLKLFRTGKSDETGKSIPENHMKTIQEYIKWNFLLKHKREKAKQAKAKLLSLLSNKAAQNELTNGKDHIRCIREDELRDNNIISVFESALTRTIKIQKDELTDALLVVQVYYFDVFKDISFYGFMYKGERYMYFTSSAGQIRKKKAMFIKESVWTGIERKIMCGLTIEKINAKGGNNVNKHLAYLALTNSATDEWKEFDIDKTIVIDDFETNVYGTYDFVDETDYSVTRKNDSIPVPHTDGAGMILPNAFGENQRNTMVRLSWVKGLLGVFDFAKFIHVNGCSPIIADVYGKEHDVIKEEIQIIFTKSQFKMYQYYDSWEEYKEYYKKYHCAAGRCNTEEERIKNSKINYQMLQTLTDITDDEIKLLTKKSADKISNICTSKETMMNILGITPYNTKLTPFQKAIKLYPALLSDSYAKDVIREVKDSLLKKYRSGKLEINGKHTFLLPDFYAACEYWFGHIDAPTGLLDNNEVFCSLFKHYDKIDCLRSPHLYKEHAVRFNAASSTYGDRALYIREWFTTNAIYTSIHDPISRILMFDVDGDKCLGVVDQDFIRIAERNMNGIVPLYYNMKKAEPTELNHKTIYAGLNSAFTHGNIGVYSNNISKIWNSDVFINGTEKAQEKAINVIKLLCMENNFCIDSAKTLYMPNRVNGFDKIISEYTNCKLPAFFIYAKDKDKSQVAEPNGSFVNKIYDLIPNRPINTRGLKLGNIEFTLLMNDAKTVCCTEVSSLYDQLNKEYRHMLNMKDESTDNMGYTASQIREQFNRLGYSDETISDMLVEYLYNHNKRYKQLLWFCYGQHIVSNLENNVPVRKTRFIKCVDCGEWVEVDLNSKKIRCESCFVLERRRIEREKKRRQRMSH